MRPSRSIERLASLPWGDLDGLAPSVLPPIDAALRGADTSKELSALLRKNPSWSAAARRIVAEAIFGVSLWRIRLAHLLGDDWRAPRRSPADYLRALMTVAHPPKGEESEDLATFYSFPGWIAEVFGRGFGDEAAALMDALNQPGPVFVRVNLLRQTIGGLARRLASEGILSEVCQFATDGLRLTTPRPNIYGSASYQAGEFEVQDEGSQLLASLLEAAPGEVIVDYCAGAGGKTLALASHMRDRGQLIAFDIDGERLSRLSRRAERAGASCVAVCRDEAALPKADAVLVDAPCSELGALRRGPDMRFRLGASIDWPSRQLEILRRASRLVRAGGRLVYATCTLRREENQGVVERFLGENKNFQLRPLPVYSPFFCEGSFTSLPHIHGTDGFFAAALESSSR